MRSAAIDNEPDLKRITAMRLLSLTLASALLFLSTSAASITADQESPTPADDGHMNNARLNKLIAKVAENITGGDGSWRFKIESYEVLVITDEKANRMRIIAPVTRSDSLTERDLMRTMQANFDSALDARYAITKGALRSAFLHRLTSLTDADFYSGLGQVVNLVATYGKTYSSGALMSRGGDSHKLNRQLYENIMRKGLSLSTASLLRLAATHKPSLARYISA